MNSMSVILAALLACAQRAPVRGEVPGARESTAQLGSSSETVDVRQYGAIGNGETDDTAALVKAFSYACAVGKRSVYVSPGIYLFDPAAAQLEVCSNETVYGAGTIRIKSDSGNYSYIFAPKSLVKDISNFTMEGITIDQNAYKNRSATISNAVGHNQTVFATYIGGHLTFRRLTVYASGVNTIVANGPSVGDVTIEQCHFIFQKLSTIKLFDNSTVYVNGKQFTILGNSFEAQKNDVAGTAIEVHEGGGLISGNDISWYYAGGNLVDTKSATVTVNTVRHAGAGFLLWSLDGKSTDHNTFSGNMIELNQVTRNTTAASGIATYYGGNGVSGNHSNIVITKNIIRFEPEGIGRTVVAYANYGIGLQCLGNVNDVLVSGNMISNSPVRGIKIGIAADNVSTADVVVTGNVIIDAGGNLDAVSSEYAAAVALEGNLSRISVFENEIRFTGRPNNTKHALYSNEKKYKFDNVRVYNNRIRSASRIPADGLSVSVTKAAPEK